MFGAAGGSFALVHHGDCGTRRARVGRWGRKAYPRLDLSLMRTAIKNAPVAVTFVTLCITIRIEPAAQCS